MSNGDKIKENYLSIMDDMKPIGAQKEVKVQQENQRHGRSQAF